MNLGRKTGERIKEMAESIDDIKWWERNKGYGIELHAYEGMYSLQEGHEYEGSWYPHWCYASKWENRKGVPDTSKKSQPNGVYFGDWEATMDALLDFIIALSKSRIPETIGILKEVITRLEGFEERGEAPF